MDVLPYVSFDFVGLLHLHDLRCWLVEFLWDYDKLWQWDSKFMQVHFIIDSAFFCYTATKLAQAQKFNDPKDPCKVLVATDAIGMGINL